MVFIRLQFIKVSFIISFTLYSAQSRVGRRNLVLRHSVPHFLPILEALRVEWQNSTPRLASTPERRNGNKNLSKYFISSRGDRTHNQSVLQSQFVLLRYDWPRLVSFICVKSKQKYKCEMTAKLNNASF